MSYESLHKKKYRDEIVSQLMEQFQYKTVMQVPKLVKVTINQGLGGATSDKKLVENALQEIALITGQKPVPTKAKNSISNFKLREGMVIGAKVTLRNERMWEFIDRLLTIALPRIRDFRGINNKSFDGRGNYSLGITEQIIFPEIDIDKVNKITGMDINFVTTAKTDAEAFALLKLLGFPFKNQKN
ncbi:MAG TPA: 50S ribosomal protein L5 [Saprospiraceae bacterium]|nr:50S ribosomal protein L5 [Saprospiraceae bacterium]MCC6689142.1 50S ribosomal protein L5 [Saprospiraceae bacterium]HMV23970.1 50S ribosomal protein L5 [Saprospiraceae bacterium]HMX82024.1 50S ribosomal protein L5 [Saprospiraceae bacterium]HMX85302.1 50S ribosomal protein L5 [Saprospiraceae bacterium]